MIIPRWDEVFGKKLNKLGQKKRTFALDNFLQDMGLENMVEDKGKLIDVA